ncbi:sugar ABC transporter permease [Capsulimonas corticalis]|uniref:Sugar ABC transporter permease n=1 Tax=Capsulimonas corticalis TaxID=2219043 RepID=A0A402CS04_9BACT|nr:carbohydrate ABC transporter permease [Capsulimonas corticalis]BDI28242.1 sugar ABC transporter permease [Capsulimonas corticalis]
MNTERSVQTGRTALTITMFLLAAIVLTPLVWLVAATLKSSDDMFHYTFFPPVSHLTLSEYHDLFTKSPFARYLANSVFVTSVTVMVQLFFSSLAGFALAKYEFKGKNIIVAIMLATLLLPGQLTMAPLYDLLYHMKMVDSYAGLIVPGAVSVFGIFLFRQSIQQVPDELLQAARIDGCSEFQIYWDIVMPVSRPMIGAFCLISFMGAWNSFLWPQIILHHAELFTLPIGLNQLVSIYQTQYGMLMAGTLLGVLPVVFLFVLLQKEFVAGLTAGAVKG